MSPLNLRSALLRTQDAIRLLSQPNPPKTAVLSALWDIRNGVMAAYGTRSGPAAPILKVVQNVETAMESALRGLGLVPGMITPGASFAPAPLSVLTSGPQGARMAMGPPGLTLPGMSTPQQAFLGPSLQSAVAALRQVEAWIRSAVGGVSGLGDALLPQHATSNAVVLALSVGVLVAAAIWLSK